jgi:ZIP family zinc transporter
LPVGGAIGAWRPPPQQISALLLAFASGALITAVAFELFESAFEHGGAWRAGVAFMVGAVVFVAVDRLIERYARGAKASGRAVGFALLAGVTLDGVPENLAMGVALIESSSITLLVAIFASNLPEATVGAQKMREAGLAPSRIVAIWSVTAVLLALAVVAGYGALDGINHEHLAWPLGFAAGAVLASLADTLMPEAYRDGGPWVALATAAGFLVSFLLSAG